MAVKYSEEMYYKIKEELKGINSEDGGWNSVFFMEIEE